MDVIFKIEDDYTCNEASCLKDAPVEFQLKIDKCIDIINGPAESEPHCETVVFNKEDIDKPFEYTYSISHGTIPDLNKLKRCQRILNTDKPSFEDVIYIKHGVHVVYYLEDGLWTYKQSELIDDPKE